MKVITTLTRHLIATALFFQITCSFTQTYISYSAFPSSIRIVKQSRNAMYFGFRCETKEQKHFECALERRPRRIRRSIRPFRSKIDRSDNVLETANSLRFLNSTEVRQALRSPVVELGVACLVLLGCLLFALQTLQWDQKTAYRLALTEDAISWAFVAEYLTRWYSRNFRPSYVLKIEMIIDLLAFLPLLLRAASITDVKGLTFLRVLRVLRLQRFFLDAESFQLFADSLPSIFGKGFRVKPYQLQVTSHRCNGRDDDFQPIFCYCVAGRPYGVEHLRPPLHHGGPCPHRGTGRESQDPGLLQRLLLRPHNTHHGRLRRHRPGKPPPPPPATKPVGPPRAGAAGDRNNRGHSRRRNAFQGRAIPASGISAALSAGGLDSWCSAAATGRTSHLSSWSVCSGSGLARTRAGVVRDLGA